MCLGGNNRYHILIPYAVFTMEVVKNLYPPYILIHIESVKESGVRVEEDFWWGFL